MCCGTHKMLAFDTAFTWEIAQLRRKLELDLRGLSSFVFWDSPTLLWIRRALLKSAWLLLWIRKVPPVYQFWPFELSKKQNVKLWWSDAVKLVLKQTFYLKILVHLTLKRHMLVFQDEASTEITAVGSALIYINLKFGTTCLRHRNP